MGSNALLFGWNRSIPGREKLSGAHFTEFVQYLGTLKQKGAIASFDTIFLDQHGGDLNGFFLLRAETSKLDALLATTEWQAHIVRAALHLQGVGVIRGFAGEAVTELMNLWNQQLPV